MASFAKFYQIMTTKSMTFFTINIDTFIDRLFRKYVNKTTD